MEERGTRLSWWIKAFILATAVIFVYKTFDNISSIFKSIGSFLTILTPFFGGLIIAFFLLPLCNRLERFLRRTKKKFFASHARSFSVLISYITLISLITLIINIVVPAVTNSLIEFAGKVPDYYTRALNFVTSLSINNKTIADLNLDEIMKKYSTADIIKMLSLDNLDMFITGLRNMTSLVFNFIMSMIIGIYILLERASIYDALRKGFSLFLKRKQLDLVKKYFGMANDILYSYFYGKALDSIIVGLISTIGFWALGAPYPPLLGLISTISNMIPYFGPIIAAVPIILLTLLSGGALRAVWIAVFILILQQVDGNFLDPKIIGKSVGLSPFWVILSITIGGGIFGITGLFLCIPVTVFLQRILNEYIEKRRLADNQA